MWILLPIGFFSVVLPRTDAGRGAPDPQNVMIRARCRRHVEALIARFPQLGGNIMETGHADYPVRLITSKGSWAAALEALAMELDYTNFKAHVAQTVDDPEYEDVLHTIWADLRAIDDRADW